MLVCKVLPEFRTVPASVAIFMSLLASWDNVVGFRARYERKTFEFVLGCCTSRCANNSCPIGERLRGLGFFDRPVRTTFDLRLKMSDLWYDDGMTYRAAF